MRSLALGFRINPYLQIAGPGKTGISIAFLSESGVLSKQHLRQKRSEKTMREPALIAEEMLNGLAM